VSSRAERRHHAQRVIAARRRYAREIDRDAEVFDEKSVAIRHPNACPRGRRCGACHHETPGQRRARAKRAAE
jgi:hypothetical protein